MNKRIEPTPGTLYLVGTPIGNLGDLSSRAKSVLKNVSAIACEDTRHSAPLIRSLGAKAPLLSFYKHNTKSRIPKIIKLLEEGKSLALITDAGLPGISDPGEELVYQAKSNGYEVLCIPGPCAALTALVSSGLPSQRFCFEGFLPKKSSERKTLLADIAIEKRTTILYESPHRLLLLLKELEVLCGPDRPLQVARELTKLHEEQVGPNIAAALKHFSEKKPMGEFTIVLGGAREEKELLYNQEKALKEMQEIIREGKTTKDAAQMIASKSHYSKRFLYELIHKKEVIVDEE